MKGKKSTVIRAKAPVKRNPAARVVNQKAQTLSDGPKRQGTRKAQFRAAIEDQE
jgi:hypothetical protein